MGEAVLVKREPLWREEFIALILANLCMFLGFQMLIPTLPVYVKKIGAQVEIRIRCRHVYRCSTFY